jgi:DNA-binding NtrC family response regulator
MIVDAHSPIEAPGILLVDDELMLLQLLQTAFQRKGFRVWACHNAHDAIKCYQENASHIDLALLDVCLPEVEGPQIYQELRRYNPEMRACFMSGFLTEQQHDSLVRLGALRIFEKPFSLPGLLDELWSLSREPLRQSA